MIKIILLDEYLFLIYYKIPSFKYNLPETTLDSQVKFLRFFQYESTLSEDTNQTIFQCCLIPNMIFNAIQPRCYFDHGI